MQLKVIAVLCLGILAVPGMAAYWSVEPVPSAGFVAGDASIAVGPSNTPCVSYTTGGVLVYASRVNQQWNAEPVASVGFWGGLSSLNVNPAGQARIAFIDASSYDQNILKLAVRQGATWGIQTVDDVGWLPERVSLAVTQSGQEVIAYCRSRSDESGITYHVSLAQHTTGGWTLEDIATVGGSTGPAAVIDEDGVVHMCFADPSSGQLKLASRPTGGTWSIKVLDGDMGEPVVPYPSIALLPAGGVAVAYFVHQTGAAHLNYGVWDGTSLHSQPVATLQVDGPYDCSLAVSGQGSPSIAYRDSGADCLKHAWRAGGTWLTETVDASPGSGSGVSLCADSTGTVSAAYVGRLADEVMYAWAIAPISSGGAKSKPEGSMVQLSGVVSSTDGGELGSSLYVQDIDRSCGIQLLFTAQVPAVTRGMLLDIQGAVANHSGEVALVDPTVRQLGTAAFPKPLRVAVRSLGGGDFFWNPGPPAIGQMGVRGGSGLSNIGLLVTVSGRAEAIGSAYFTLDDGSSAPVKCWCSGIVPPPLNCYVRVTGISSCQQEDTELVSLLRVRSAADIVIVPE